MKRVVTSYTDNGSGIVYVSDHKNESNIIYMGFLVHSDVWENPDDWMAWHPSSSFLAEICCFFERCFSFAGPNQKHSLVAMERLALKIAKEASAALKTDPDCFSADCWAFIKLWLIIDIKLNAAFNLLTNDIDQLMERMLNTQNWTTQSTWTKIFEGLSLALNK